ncbi:hypothetical protein KA344_02105 [bacterium]|jgi:hypothetical protein|nr:hypothetical protein [bacterium]
MGKQRTSRPQAFKATAAATSEIKAHVGENNPANALRKSNASETRFADGELADLLDNYLSKGTGLKTSKLIPINGYPSLKLPND